jgi:hypothetical protein
VELGGINELHAAWLEHLAGNPGISLVFREMWDTTDVDL